VYQFLCFYANVNNSSKISYYAAGLAAIQYYAALSGWWGGVICCTMALLGHNSLSEWSTLNAFLPDSVKLSANVDSFSHAALWFNQGH